MEVVEPAEAFADSPVDARLAAALVAVETLRDQREIESDDLSALIDHLRRWLSVDETNFQEWHAFDSPLLEAALGGALPLEAVNAFARAGLNEAMSRRLITGLVEIVYWSLFAAIDDDATQAHMEAVAEVVSQFGIPWPPRSRFLLRAGRARPSSDDVRRWRTDT
jgi:hypothetical protein